MTVAGGKRLSRRLSLTGPAKKEGLGFMSALDFPQDTNRRLFLGICLIVPIAIFLTILIGFDVASGRAPPPAPPWVNPDGTVDLAKYPQKVPLLDPKTHKVTGWVDLTEELEAPRDHATMGHRSVLEDGVELVRVRPDEVVRPVERHAARNRAP